jgi:Excalibur calcium-binding domain
VLCALALAAAGSAGARVPAQWRNCSTVHVRYPHGVAKLGAHDRTSGDPVTNFRRSTMLYLLAMRYNRGLDRDHDGIACEQL